MIKNNKLLHTKELYDLGWDNETINTLMPNPDKVFNKGEPWARPQNMYYEHRVHKIMKTVKFKKLKMLTKSQIKERGWSDSMINKLLGLPDRLEENPFYKNAKPMKLYSLYRVEKAEKTEEYDILMSKKMKRSKIAQDITKQRRDQYLAKVKGINIIIPIYDEDDLKQRAVSHYNNLWTERGEDKYASTEGDHEFLKRIMVNFLRHGRSKYEKLLDDSYGEIGAIEARHIIRELVLQKIAEVYPYLKDECLRQLEHASNHLPTGRSHYHSQH